MLPLQAFVMLLLNRVQQPGTLRRLGRHPFRQFRPRSRLRPDDQFLGLPGRMPLELERQHADVRRIIDHLHRGADEREPRLVLLVGKADAAGLVHLPVFAVQEGVGYGGRVKEAQGLVVLLVGLVGRDAVAFLAKCAVGLVLVAFHQPDVEQAVERIQRLGCVQAGFRQELVDGTVEPFNLTGRLRRVRLGEKQPHTQLCARAFHPFVTELLSVVEVYGIRQSKLETACRKQFGR